jgi:hypothetical protein
MDANSRALDIQGLNKAHPLLDFEKDYSVFFLRGIAAIRNGFPKHTAEARQHES